MNDIVFELSDVHYSYLGRQPALSGIDMKVRAGEKIAIIGANGAGKSTLLHLLDGLIFPDRGEVKAFGRKLTEDFFSEPEAARQFRRQVGLVFQNADIQLFCPTVEEDIAFGPLQLGVAAEDVNIRVRETARLLEIEHLLARVPYQLSIGEKRKVAMASVLAIDPSVLLLDEPTAGLDPATVRHLIDLILATNQAGKTVILATHDLHFVEAIADVVYVFSRDKTIVRFGPTDEILLDTPFLAAHNLIHTHSHRHQNKLHSHPHDHFEHRH